MSKKSAASASAATVKEIEVSEPVTEAKLDEKGRISVVALSMEEIEKRGYANKSQMIRGLDADGYSRSAIAKFMDIRYQFVRNVLESPLKRVVSVKPAGGE